MLKYVVRRILQMIPVFIGVTLILFVLRAPGVLPGDPVRMITGERGISDALREQIIEKHGLDQPLVTQYRLYVQNLLQGDLGESYQRGTPRHGYPGRQAP
jgi:dipeptide transport system permease protein